MTRVDYINYTTKNGKSSMTFVNGLPITRIRMECIRLILSGDVRDYSKTNKRYPKNSYQIYLFSSNDHLRDIGEATVGAVAYVNKVFYYENFEKGGLYTLNMDGTILKKIDRIKW